MQIRIGLENGIEGRSLAWVLDFPGCFAYGKDGTEAILRTPQALITFREWVGEHTKDSWLEDLEDFDIALTEISQGCDEGTHSEARRVAARRRTDVHESLRGLCHDRAPTLRRPAG